MRGITGWLAVVVVLLLHGGGAGVAADPWQLDGWKARAVVTIAKPLPDASVDSAHSSTTAADAGPAAVTLLPAE